MSLDPRDPGSEAATGRSDFPSSAPVVLLATALLVLATAHVLSEDAPLRPLELTLFAALSSPLFGLGYYVHRSDLTLYHGAMITAFTVATTAAAGALEVVTIRIETMEGTLVGDPTSLVVAAMFGGAMVGAPLSTLYARLRQNQSALEREHEEARRLAMRLSTKNRVLRHNLKNSLNVVAGWATRLAEEQPDETVERHLRPILDATDRLLSLSLQADRLHRLFETADDATRRHSLGSVLGEAAAEAGETRPDCRVTAEAGPHADVTVGAHPHLGEAVVELATRLCALSDSPSPRVRLSVPEATAGAATLEACVDGTVPDIELLPLQGEEEREIAHATDLSLWYVYWVVAVSNGTVGVTADGDDTTVRVTLPRA